MFLACCFFKTPGFLESTFLKIFLSKTFISSWSSITFLKVYVSLVWPSFIVVKIFLLPTHISFLSGNLKVPLFVITVTFLTVIDVPQSFGGTKIKNCFEKSKYLSILKLQ